MEKKKKRLPSLTHDKTSGLLNFMDYKNPFNKFLYGVIIFFLVIFVLVALLPIFGLLFHHLNLQHNLMIQMLHFFLQNGNLIE